MVNQGLLGAIEQYFTVESKPRLHRRNSWFEDHYEIFSIYLLQVVGIVALLVLTIVILWCLMGVVS